MENRFEFKDRAQISKELTEIMLAKSSDAEEKAREYIVYNFDNLPKSLQRDVSLAFLGKGIEEKLEAEGEKYAKKAVDVMGICKMIKENLESQASN